MDEEREFPVEELEASEDVEDEEEGLGDATGTSSKYGYQC